MPARLVVHDNAQSFLRAAGEWLNGEEIEANLALGVAIRLRDFPEWFTEPAYLATLHGDGDNAPAWGVAVRTPPWHLVLHAAPGHEVELASHVADDLLERNLPPNGVNGRLPCPVVFAEAWGRRTGQEARLQTSLRAFALRQVAWPPPAPGRLRLAQAADAGLLHTWIAAFHHEAEPDAPAPSEERAQRMIEQQTAWFWEHAGRPVSLVATGRRLPHGIVVGPVYTPHEFRGRGFASNAVAQASAQLLEQGHEYVALFTDITNPTSNHIYQMIGYEAVCDYGDYGFV